MSTNKIPVKSLVIALALISLGTISSTNSQELPPERQEIIDLFTQAKQAESEGRYKDAIVLVEKTIRLTQNILGPDSTDIAILTDYLARLCYKSGNYSRAEKLYKSAIEIIENNLGPDDPGVAISINGLAVLYKAMGDYSRAEKLYKKAIEINEKAGSPETNIALDNLAQLYVDRGDYTLAEPIYKRVLEIRENAFGPNNPVIATNIDNLAGLYYLIGDYARALPLFERSLKIRENALGPNHPDVALSLSNIAVIYLITGDYARALPLLKRSLEIREKTLGPNHPDVARSLTTLGSVYEKMGDYASAESLLKRALEIIEKKKDKNQYEISIFLDNLAALYISMGDYDRALPLLKRSLEIREKTLGPNHSDVAISLNNLAVFYVSMGDYNHALPLSKRVIEIQGKTLSPNHPRIAANLNNLATIYKNMGDYTQAEFMYQRSIDIYEKTLGPNHPDVASSLSNLAELYIRMNKLNNAVHPIRRAVDITLKNISETFSIASERQKLGLIEKYSWHQDILLSTVVGLSSNIEAKMAGLTTILRFKGIVLDAMIGEREAVRKGLSPELKTAYEKLQRIRQEISSLYIKGVRNDPAEYRKKMEELEILKDNLEVQLSKGSAEFASNREMFFATPDAVCTKMPKSSALIDYVEFNRYSAEKWKPWMAAFVLEKDKCSVPTMVDLGPAQPIQKAVKTWREELEAFSTGGKNEDEARKKLDEKGKAVYDLVWKPVMRAQKTGTRNEYMSPHSVVYISPDGPLNLMPMEALPAEGGGYLIEKMNLAYVSSGKDFLRSKKASNRNGALLVGGADFNMGIAQQAQVASASSVKRGQCGKLNSLQWNPLPGTAAEVDAIGSAFTGKKIAVNPLKGAKAQKAGVITGMQNAKYVHLATHGFFLGDECGFAEDSRGIGGVRPGMQGQEMMISSQAAGPVRKENPLLLSGLALAGANNTWKSGASGNDGYLLAMEVANLDLEGVELVTLSACQTGLGEIKRGEGVFGLKRSFMIAGAEALIMSLWSVPDKETKELMVDFYNKILSGAPKRESFRNSQLKMMKSGPGGSYRHPFYWAAFQYIGVN